MGCLGQLLPWPIPLPSPSPTHYLSHEHNINQTRPLKQVRPSQAPHLDRTDLLLSSGNKHLMGIWNRQLSLSACNWDTSLKMIWEMSNEKNWRSVWKLGASVELNLSLLPLDKRTPRAHAGQRWDTAGASFSRARLAYFPQSCSSKRLHGHFRNSRPV